HKADHSLKQKLIAHFDVEAIDKYYAKLRFAQMTDMLLFREQQNFISKKDTSQFVACGFPQVTFKDSDKLAFKHWLSTKFKFANQIQLSFKHSYLVTQNYYRALVISSAGSLSIKSSNPASLDNFVLFVNRAGSFVILYLPNKTEPYIELAATIGEIRDEVELLSVLESNRLSVSWFKSNTRIMNHINHEKGWEKVLANKLVHLNLVEEKALEFYINRT
ncbi:hypothetical protein, partial [Oleiphilus sp. HI0132]